MSHIPTAIVTRAVAALIVATSVVASPPGQTHIFYYPWWGNPARDGDYRHWNHEVLEPAPADSAVPAAYSGGEDIGASFYPRAGCYSSHDSTAVDRQVRQLDAAGVEVIVASWWGRDTFEDRALPLLLDGAARRDLQVCIHLEPYPGRSCVSIRDDLAYLQERYGSHPAWLRLPTAGNRTLYYVYDSYQITTTDWALLLAPDGELTVRDTELDALFLALLVEADDRDSLRAAQFDGFYTYFAATGFSYGSTPVNWPRLSAWAREHGLLFVPCVGPGYDDLRVRPWNGANRRSREEGAYYDRMWTRALAADPGLIAITSYNEWHEGTQIEPAVPFAMADYSYTNYTPLDPEYYLHRTRSWTDRYRDCLQKGCGRVSPDCVPAPTAVELYHTGRQATLELGVQPDPRYPGSGPGSLLDGQLAAPTYRDGRWLGFEGVRLRLEIDLGTAMTITECRAGFLEQQVVWVFPPTLFQMEYSLDGLNYVIAIHTQTERITPSDIARRLESGGGFTPIRARYVRITASGPAACPDWHAGAGGKPWLFVDEVIIN